MKTTLNQIRKYSPCASGYKKLLKFLGKTEADDEELDVLTILESNGLEDTIWCFRAVSSGYEKELRLFAVFCARQVQHLMTDPISIAAIDVSERYANGQATDEELKAAHAAAYAAACVAAYTAAAAHAACAAYYAAYSASHDAARAADPKDISILEAYLKELLSEK